jgi:TRAP transporter 4TM/12TM fusion protein
MIFGAEETGKMDKVLSSIVLGCSILLAIFSFFLPIYAFIPNLIERAIHLGLVIPLVFLAGKNIKSKAALFLNLLITCLGLFLCLYIIIDFEGVLEQYGIVKNNVQVVMGLLMALIVMEAARRMIKPVLPAITFLFFLYLLLGHHIPGFFGHVKYDLSQITGMLYLTTGGIWGQLTGISANIIAIFVFLGAFIGYTGGGIGFRKISIRVAGKLKGGPGKVAAIASAMFGSISGSASANVVTTGAFTIPMMKRQGFRPPFAAAVEAVASTGGQILPPIMGAGAFIMAELTGTPYLKIVLSASFPALLYFYTCWVGIHFFAMRDGLHGLESRELPSWSETIRASSFFVIPIAILIFLLANLFTPQYSAFWATVSTFPLAFFTSDWKFDRTFLSKIKGAIQEGASQVAVIASICACAQIIIAILLYTGLGVKISTFIVDVGGGSLFLTLVLTMVTCIILGMEVPTTAAYIMAAIVAAPVLIKLGLHPIAAHLFVFYYAILSAITPPVCGVVYIASGMAGSDWMETARYSLRLSYAAFLLPFVFVYDYSLLLLGGSPLHMILAIIRTMMAMLMLSAGFIGQFRKNLTSVGRLILLGIGILWIVNYWLWDLIALIGTLLVIWDRNWLYRNSPHFHRTKTDESIFEG